LFEGYGARGLLAEFPMKNWMKGRLDTLLKKLKKNGNTDWKRGSSSLFQNLPITETWRFRRVVQTNTTPEGLCFFILYMVYDQGIWLGIYSYLPLW